MKNLNFWTIIIVGIALSIVPLAFGLFWHWIPNNTEAGYYQTYNEQLTAEINKRGSALNRRDKALALVEQKAAEWRQIVATRTPPRSVEAGGIDLGVHGWQLVQDARRFRNNVQRAVNAQVRRGGVTVLQGPLVPFPDESATTVVANYFNYPAIAFPVVTFNFGEVVVQGTYDQIMANVRSYSSMPRYLAVASGLRLEGTSPRLTGRYNLAVIGFIQGDKIFPTVPESGGGGGPAGPGAFGGPGGGPPGGFTFGAGGAASVAGGGPPPTAAGGPSTGRGQEDDE